MYGLTLDELAGLRIAVGSTRLLRRRVDVQTEADEERLRVGRITLHPEQYEVYVDKDRITLTLTQFRLLQAMARRPGWVVSPDQFQRRFGQSTREAPVSGASIKHHIAALRRKLGVAAVQLETVRGQGYRLIEDQAKSVGNENQTQD